LSAFGAFYDRTLALSRGRHATATMAAVSFADSSFLPVPPHPLLALLVMADPARAYRYAAICTLASVAGGFLGYAIGDVLYDTVGRWLIARLHYETQMEAFQTLFAQWGFWLIAGKGLTPIPFKIVTIGAGIAQYPLAPFFAASVLARGVQFYAIAWLLKHQGGRIDGFVRRYGASLGWTATALAVAVLAWLIWR
jgi:membrane protein YqaA with SNARE-associated domain